MSDQKPQTGQHDKPVGEPQRLTVDHLRRAAESCRNLSDPVLMAKAWDEAPTPNVPPATNTPRGFGQVLSLSVPDNFDDPQPHAEIAAREVNSPSQAPGGPSGLVIAITSL